MLCVLISAFVGTLNIYKGLHAAISRAVPVLDNACNASNSKGQLGTAYVVRVWNWGHSPGCMVLACLLGI